MLITDGKGKQKEEDLQGSGVQSCEWLVNPRDAKNYADKKTDEADAHWLMVLHTYGLLKPCYQPDNIARSIRNLSRQCDDLMVIVVVR